MVRVGIKVHNLKQFRKFWLFKINSDNLSDLAVTGFDCNISLRQSRCPTCLNIIHGEFDSLHFQDNKLIGCYFENCKLSKMTICGHKMTMLPK